MVLLALAITVIFEDGIKKMAVRELNKHLQSEVVINTHNIHFSLLKHFPNASLSFEQFKIKESFPAGQDYFAEVGKLSLIFSPLDLIKGNYTIHKIAIENADIRMVTDAKGNINYMFWKSVPSSTKTTSDFKINLKDISLSKVRLLYDDHQAGFKTDLDIAKAKLSGKFSEEKFDLSANADLLAHELNFGSFKAITNKELSLKTILEVNNTEDRYVIKHGHLNLGKAAFAIAGQAQNLKEGVNLDFNVKGDETNIQTLLALLPTEYANYFKDYESEGKILFDANIKGMASSSKIPSIDVEFGIKQGTIQQKGKNLALKSVNFNGKYTNGKSRNNISSVLEIKDFKAQLNGRDITADLTLKDFDNPFLQLMIKANVNLSDVKNFITVENITDMGGELSLDAAFQGRIKDLNTLNSISKTSMTGKMLIRNVLIQSTKQPLAYKDMNGQFIFDGNNLLIDNFQGIYGSTDFLLNGAFKNLASWLFLSKQDLITDVSLQCKLFRLDDFMTETSSGNDTSYQFSFPAFMVCRMQLQANQFEYGKMVANNLRAKIFAQNGKANLDNIQFNTMGGSVTATGNIEQMPNGNLKTNFDANLSRIDVTQLFYQMDNFGQEYFTDNHIKGKLKAHIEYSSQWKPNLDADLSSIIAKAEVGIENGEINNFDPLIRMGKFLKISSLNHLIFDHLSNTISIRDQKILIPQMDISSSAMNMSIAGSHTFDNYMDYKLRMNVSQLLFGKKKDYESEFGTITVDEKGGLNLFLTMKGPASDPKISYDAKSSFSNLKQGFKQEKNELKSIFTDKEPDGKKTQDLNKTQKGYGISFDEDEEEAPITPSNSKEDASKTELKRKKAFEELKNKLNNKDR